MFIQMRDFQKIFQDYPNRTIGKDTLFCLTSFFFLTDDICPSYSSHCLYVIQNPELLQKICPISNISLLMLTEDLDAAASLCQNIEDPFSMLILQTKDIHTVCDRLQHFFDEFCGMGCFSDSLLEILFFEGGIQAMLEKVYPAFQNPMYVFDTDFTLIASTYDAATDKEQGKEIIEHGGFTQTEFDILNQSRLHEKLKVSDYPIKSKHPVYGYDQLLCNIDTQKDMGHIVINGLNHPLTDTDQKMLYILKKAIDQQMKKDEFIRNNRGFHYEYFLRDLLDGKLAVGPAYKNRMSYVNTQFSGNLYCMVIETARSSHTLNTLHIRSCFENEFPGTMTLMYHGGIIILLRFPENEFLTDEGYEKIIGICHEYGLYAGIGNCFQNVMHLAEYYHQALRSVELGICSKNEPSLFVYQDYYLSHITNIFTQKESASTFCHPQLQLIMDYDKENETDYAHILYTWLICERNIATTAEALYMHRNTLVYRLKKINSLISVNYDNYLERQHIILSYELFMR